MAVHAFSSSLNLLGRGRRTAGHELVPVQQDSVPFSAVERLGRKLAVTPASLLAIIGIPERTAIRRREEGFLKPEEADRLLRVARIFEDAVRIFGTEIKAAKWLGAPNPLTYDVAPLELLSSDAGTQAVSEELVRIDFGDFA